MKIRRIITITTLMILIMVTLSGCGVKKLSGTYVSELDSTEYFKFSGESKVTFYSNQDSIDGAYRIVDNAAILYFDLEPDPSVILLEIKNKNTLYYTMTAYVKQGFWKKHWKKFVIGSMVLGVFSIIYKKVTGRDLEDDIEKLSDQF